MTNSPDRVRKEQNENRVHHHADANSSTPDSVREEDSARANDPVCGMSVDPAFAISRRHDARDYFFCSEHCANSFADDSAKYLTPAATPAKPAPDPSGVV